MPIAFGFQQISFFTVLIFLKVQLLATQYLGGAGAIIAQFLLALCAASAGIVLLFRLLDGHALGMLVSVSFFLFSAIIFDYTVMGWVYVLITLSLLPLCLWAFIRGLEGNRTLLLLSAVLSAMTESQAIVWYFICFLAVVVAFMLKRREPWNAVKALAVVLLVFVLGNAYWFPGLFLYPPSYVASSDIVSSAVSLGIMGHYHPLNAVRVWGALYNFQFENIQTLAGLAVFSFIPPVLAIIGLLTARSPYKWAFALLMLSPVVLMFLGAHRELLAAIPFANAFRDVSRLSVLALLGTSVLAGLGAESIFQWAAARWDRLGQVGVAALLAIGLGGATYPWWSGEMTDWQATKGPDIRLRLKDFPRSYFRLESRLAKQRMLQKAMYYPLGGTVSFRDDPRFIGAYQETQDIFAMYSPVPGIVAISDRKYGAVDALTERLAHDEPNRAQLRMLAESGVRLFIFRRNMLGPYPTPSAALVGKMLGNGDWSPWFEDKEVVAYAAKWFKPIVFTVPDGRGGVGSDAPTVEFRKIAPTLYRLRIHDIREHFMLVLNESYNGYWRLALAPPVEAGRTIIPSAPSWASVDGAATGTELAHYINEGSLTLPSIVNRKIGDNANKLRFISARNQGTIQNDNLPDISLIGMLMAPTINGSRHVTTNGFANGWMIDPSSLCKRVNACVRSADGKISIDLMIEFLPQRVFYLGGIVTLINYATLFIIWASFVLRRALHLRHDRACG